MSDWHHHHLDDDILFHRHWNYEHSLTVKAAQTIRIDPLGEPAPTISERELRVAPAPECRLDPRQCVYRAHDDT